MGLLAVVVALSAYPATWRTQVVDAGGGGKYANLLIDRFGNAHASYSSDQSHQLKYAFWDHLLNRWFTMVVDNRCSGFVSMALDSHDRPHISYLDYGTNRLKYAYWDGAMWHSQTPNIYSKAIEFYTSITLDSEDHPIISYYNVATPDDVVVIRLRVIRLVGGAWETETVDSTLGSGKFNSIASNAGSNLQVAYANVHYESQSVRYARWNGKSWDTQIVENTPVNPVGIAYFSVNLAIDSAGTPHIAYTDTINRRIKYATLRDGKWQPEVADSIARGAYPDRNGITLSPDGTPYLSYYDAGRGVLKVARREDTKWVTEEVDSNFAGYTSAIQVTGDEVIVVYYDESSDSLKCARRPVHSSVPSNTSPILSPDAGK
ncbi:MAG: hypothetical protein WBW33_23045 [Bryobacteraceae bacterium]